MGITVIGSLNYDLVTYTDRIPDGGETMRANVFETHTGGKGLNQAIAIARLKQEDSEYAVKMVGNVGDDSFGVELMKILKENKIETSDVGVLSDVKTGIATILVEQKKGSQNRILITEGANGKTVYKDEALENIFVKYENEKQFVVLQHEIPDPCSIIRWIKKKHPKYQVVFNPSPFQPLNKEDWLLIDVLIVNEIEALQIVRSVYTQNEITKHENDIKENFINGYKILCQKFQNFLVNHHSSIATVIITLGANGALFSSRDHPNVGYAPACSNVTVVDTTGAGDTFIGACVTQLYQNTRLEKVIDFATSASSITIQNKGAAESIPYYNDVLKCLP